MKRLLVVLAALILPACGDGDDDGFKVVYVDAASGNDITGDGSQSAPFRTLTRGLAAASGFDVVHAAPGTYNAALGEVFPLRFGQQILLDGDAATLGVGPAATLISGGGSYTIQGGAQVGMVVNAAVVLEGAGELSGFTVTNAGGVGVVFDNSAAFVNSCTITGNLLDGVRLFTGQSAQVAFNAITANSGNGVQTFDATTPDILVNTITNNSEDGVRAGNTSNPRLRLPSSSAGNTLQGNTGVGLFNDTTGSIIFAPSQTWRVSVQGSSPTGTYGAGTTLGPLSFSAGNNFAITNAAAGTQF